MIYKKENVQLRCIHRHTLAEHPQCFLKGLVKYEFKDDREWEKLTGLPWYNFPGYKMGYFDIEVDNLNADFGTVLSWCIKERDGQIISDIITKEDLFNGEQDKRIVNSFVETLKQFDIVMGYYSDNFDMPYMRAKAMHFDMPFPEYGDLYHWDLYWTARSKLKISRKRLENVCGYLNIAGKTHIDKEAWRHAKYGDVKSLEEVLDHNKWDVIILEKLHNKLSATRRWTRKSV